MTQNTVFGIREKRKSEILCLIISVNFGIRGNCNFKNIVLKIFLGKIQGRRCVRERNNVFKFPFICLQIVLTEFIRVWRNMYGTTQKRESTRILVLEFLVNYGQEGRLSDSFSRFVRPRKLEFSYFSSSASYSIHLLLIVKEKFRDNPWKEKF